MLLSDLDYWPKTTSSSSETWGSCLCRLKVRQGFFLVFFIKGTHFSNLSHQHIELSPLLIDVLGEGAINVAMGPNRGQEVRVNGPMGAPGQMRMDVGFPGQPGSGRSPVGKFVFKLVILGHVSNSLQ